jgi:hypothetical protein
MTRPAAPAKYVLAEDAGGGENLQFRYVHFSDQND